MDNRKPQSQSSKPKVSGRQISEARLAAFEILLKIEKERSFSAVLLPLYEAGLEVKDRALCHELTLGILRKKIYLDRVLQKYTKIKLEKFDLEVLTAIRLGIYQLLFLDKIPVFAAINESVNLVYRAKKKSASGLVNAVLRNISRQKNIELEFADEIEKISVETSHPQWLVEHWTKEFGFEEAQSLAAANNQTPFSAFRLTGKSDNRTIEILQKLGSEITESKIVAGGWRVSKSNEYLRAFAEEGKIYFQEESSQLVAKAVNLQNKETFLDVCAAPGSKTTQISYESGPANFEASIFAAGDKYFQRLRLLREICEKSGAGNVQIIAYDAETALPFPDQLFDCVLVDAPCSGTGTIRHNPEIRYFLEAEDLRGFPGKQLAILKNASKILKQGGRLVYSTCSLEMAENEQVAERFLAENRNFQKILPRLPQQFLTENEYARTFPQRDETDGFFIAVFQKL